MKFLRYPGGKTRLLQYLQPHMPCGKDIKGLYIEPFVGGGSVFFYLQPNQALLCDLNRDLISLYKGIKLYPHKVWANFEALPSGKRQYYMIRGADISQFKLYEKAARILYLNRTCFKGMWRHNEQGQFNVGYGGDARRWVVTHESIKEVCALLRRTEIAQLDFQATVENADKNSFLFLDPPYKPGEKDLKEAHYSNGRFAFDEQQRLATCLFSLPKSKKIRWAMTNSSHKDILKLYKGCTIRKIPIGTGDRPGILTKNGKEVLITNY